MNEFPRGLLVVLCVLSLGICADGGAVYYGGPYWWIALLALLGRLAAIGGIVARSRTGWWLAMGFFIVIIALNVSVALMVKTQGFSMLMGTIVPAACALYLVSAKGEFE